MMSYSELLHVLCAILRYFEPFPLFCAISSYFCHSTSFPYVPCILGYFSLFWSILCYSTLPMEFWAISHRLLLFTIILYCHVSFPLLPIVWAIPRYLCYFTLFHMVCAILRRFQVFPVILSYLELFPVVWAISRLLICFELFSVILSCFPSWWAISHYVEPFWAIPSCSRYFSLYEQFYCIIASTCQLWCSSGVHVQRGVTSQQGGGGDRVWGGIWH